MISARANVRDLPLNCVKVKVNYSTVTHQISMQSVNGRCRMAVPLEIICEMSVACGSFPSFWRRANVVSLHKKGSKKIPENYRSVSLLPICSKILEKVVFENLLPACLPAIPTNQHGFLPGRSCVTNLSCFLDHCWSSISKGKQTDAIYTDFSSAFTSVNHVLLLHKLRSSFHITGLAHAWLTS